jgi:hypothetical protein
MAKKIETVDAGTGDVFRDLGYTDAEVKGARSDRRLRSQFAISKRQGLDWGIKQIKRIRIEVAVEQAILPPRVGSS